MALELLQAIVGRIHDFCGSLEEDNLRTNFVLIYELIDEIIVSFLLTRLMMFGLGFWTPSND